MWTGSKTGVEVNFSAIPLGSTGFRGVPCVEMEIVSFCVCAERRLVGRIGAISAVKMRERFEFLSGGFAETELSLES